jgi:hypothetical protein
MLRSRAHAASRGNGRDGRCRGGRFGVHAETVDEAVDALFMLR